MYNRRSSVATVMSGVRDAVFTAFSDKSSSRSDECNFFVLCIRDSR